MNSKTTCQRFARPLVMIAALYGCALAPSELCAQRGDIIFLRSGGRSVSGSIETSSPDELQINTSDGLKTIATDNILRITLSEDPPGLGAARSEVVAGQYEDADSRLQKIKESTRALVNEDIAFHQALVKSRRAMQGVGDVREAAKQMNAFLKRYPKSFRTYAGLEVMGDLATSLGKFDAAVSFYGKLAAAQSTLVKARGALLQGEALLTKGDTEQAMKEFQQVATSQDDRMKSLGTIGVAVCRARGGNPDEGVSMIEKIVAENDATDVELFARAYNAMGECHLLGNQNEDAVLAYLHTDLLFNRDYNAHAEALYRLSKLWATINKPAEAAKYRQLLKERYAASSWAQK